MASLACVLFSTKAVSYILLIMALGGEIPYFLVRPFLFIEITFVVYYFYFALLLRHLEY